MCAALAPLAIAATLAGPMCPRADGPAMAAVMVALVGDARVEPASTDPQFEAAIRAIRAPNAAPKPAKRRSRR
ncbi:MAG: hypothetical protein MIL41_16875 [Hyphomicrobiales bacterium]|jgi:hypothetical protein